MSDEILVDARGLHCPMPLLKAKLALNSMAVGQVVKVLASDAGSKKDIPAFVAQSVHQLVEQTESDNSFVFLIKKQSIISQECDVCQNPGIKPFSN